MINDAFLNALVEQSPLREDEKSRVRSVVAWLCTLPSLVEKELDSLQVYPKGKSDILTSLDLAVERNFINTVMSNHCEDSLLSEECGYVKGSSVFFHVLDPIDLTRNVPRGLPFLSLYTCLQSNQPLMSVAIQFRPNECLLGLKGLGSFSVEYPSGITKQLSNRNHSNGHDFRYVKVHNFSILKQNFLAEKKLSSSRHVFSELLHGQSHCVIFSLDDIGLQWGFFAWDFLPYFHLLLLSDKYEVFYLPEGREPRILNDGRLGYEDELLKGVLCYDKNKKSESFRLLSGEE
ncbi:MAG: hypothetical protein NZO16_02325 [Deltaproteobacteria bacterium]|nr:hypothetical protein [Deltaproteobacteria bacterium]